MRLILDYVLDEVLSADGDTVVHRARRLPGGHPVVIKVAADHLRAEDLARVEEGLRAEAKLLAPGGEVDRPAGGPLIELIDGGYEPGGGGAPVALVYDRAALDAVLLELVGGERVGDERVGPARSPVAPRVLPRPSVAPPDRRPLVMGAVVVGSLVVVAAVAATWLIGGQARSPHPTAPATETLAPTEASDTTDHATARPDADAAPPPAKAPCPGDEPAIPAGAVAVAGDPSGTGCTVTLVWWPDRAELDRPEASGAQGRFVLGDPGDQLVLGDWDGDGRDTPAIYDPQRGEVVRFDTWAEPGQSLTGTVDTAPVLTGGLADVRRRIGGDAVEVLPAPPG